MATILPGWPCHLDLTPPPSIEDRLSSPSRDEIAGQTIGNLTPRGPAWGTDEAGDGMGASPGWRQLWRAYAGWLAVQFARDFDVLRQAFPSEIDVALTDWEDELGLPDRCLGLNPTNETRKNAVRQKHRAIGSASPAYFICLARSLGCDVMISEIDSWKCGESTCGEPVDEADDDQIGPQLIDATWIVSIASEAEFFECAVSECGVDPLTGFTPIPALECLMADHSPTATILVIRYFDLDL